MTPQELRAIRLNLGMTQEQLAPYLGFQGDSATLMTGVSRLERGTRNIMSRHIWGLVDALDRWGKVGDQSTDTTTGPIPLRAPDDITTDNETPQEDATK
jgi:transcriptional regulator with XRE-family HTH domain